MAVTSMRHISHVKAYQALLRLNFHQHAQGEPGNEYVTQITLFIIVISIVSIVNEN